MDENDRDYFTMFMGRPLIYWQELQRLAESLNYQNLIAEIAQLKRENRIIKEDLDRIVKAVEKHLK